MSTVYSLPFAGPQQAAGSGCCVDLLNDCEDCGTSSAGFFVKNPSGFNITLMRSIGMTGKSSMRGLWVRPNATHVSFPSLLGVRRRLTVPEDNVFVFYRVIPLHPFLDTLAFLALVGKFARCE